MRARTFLCWTMFLLLPVSVMAAGLNTAMAHPYGASWLNGASVEHASAIFPGDLVQTNPGSILKIDASGSTLTVLSDSLVKFEGNSAAIERGSAKLQTSTSMSAHAGIVTVTPASSAPTEFQMINTSGAVQVVALKGDLRITNGSQTTTLSQGQQATQTASTMDQKMEGVGTAMIRQKAPAFTVEAAKASGIQPDVRGVEGATTKKGKGSPKLP